MSQRQEAIYTIRLLQVAKWLESRNKEPEPYIQQCYLESQLNHLTIVYHCKINMQMFNGLPHIFPKDWAFNGKWHLEPQLKSLPDYELSMAFMFYFGMLPEEFIHCFDCHGRYQNLKKWGGVHLIETSSVWDVAYNIREYIARKSGPNPKSKI